MGYKVKFMFVIMVCIWEFKVIYVFVNIRVVIVMCF